MLHNKEPCGLTTELFLASSSTRTKKGAHSKASPLYTGDCTQARFSSEYYFLLHPFPFFSPSVLENMGMRTQGDLRLRSIDRKQSLVYKPTARTRGQFVLRCNSSALSAAHSWPNPNLNEADGNLSTDFHRLSIRAQARAWLD